EILESRLLLNHAPATFSATALSRPEMGPTQVLREAPSQPCPASPYEAGSLVRLPAEPVRQGCSAAGPAPVHEGARTLFGERSPPQTGDPVRAVILTGNGGGTLPR